MWELFGDAEPTYHPGNSYDTHYRPLTIAVAEDIPPIRAWTDGSGRIAFYAGRWRLYTDEFTDGWIVTAEYNLYALTSYQMHLAMRNEFVMALAEAATVHEHVCEHPDERVSGRVFAVFVALIRRSLLRVPLRDSVRP